MLNEEKNIPQDPSALDNYTKDICYVIDENGNYTTVASRGWEVKSTALDVTWNDIKARISEIKNKVKQGKASPIHFFMELKLMDIKTLAAYTGFWQWQVKKHLKPANFNKLSNKKLQKYATVFEITVDELKTMEHDENRF